MIDCCISVCVASTIESVASPILTWWCKRRAVPTAVVIAAVVGLTVKAANSKLPICAVDLIEYE